jgi:hypothetical protein
METIKIDRSFLSQAQFDLAIQYFTSTFTQNPQPVAFSTLILVKLPFSVVLHL